MIRVRRGSTRLPVEGLEKTVAKQRAHLALDYVGMNEERYRSTYLPVFGSTVWAVPVLPATL